MCIRLSIIIAIVGLNAIEVFCKEQYKFSFLNVNNGLSNNQVNAIVQDENGFIWVGTEDGLNRFDGFQCKTYKSQSDNNESIAFNRINRLYCDKNGDLWISYVGEGVSRYNYREDRFIHYTFDNSESIFGPAPIRVFFEDNEGNLIIGGSSGLRIFDEKNNVFKDFFEVFNLKLEGENVIINSIVEDTRNQLWLATSNETYVISADRNHIEHISINQDVKNSNRWTQQVVLGPDSLIYIIKQNYILTTTPDLNSINYFRDFDQYISGIVFNRKNDIWVGTEKLIRISNNKIFTYTANRFDDSSIPDDIIRSIYMDNNGTLWVGTWTEGLFYFNASDIKHQFHNYFKGDGETSLPENPIDYIYETKDKSIWVLSNWGGVSKLNVELNEFIHYNSINQNSHSISVNLNHCIFQDDKIYLGTFREGVDIYNEESNSFEGNPIIKINGHIPAIYDIKSNLKDSNYLFLATQYGLVKYDKSNGKCEFYDPERYNLPEEDIIQLTYLNENQIIIAFEKYGLFLLNITTDDIRPLLTDLSSMYVNTVVKPDFSDYLFIGTDNGLDVWDFKSQTLHNFNIDDGLPGNSIYAIVMDEKEDVWISTLNGIAKITFDYNGNGIRIADLLTYVESDGLPGNQFRKRAGTLLSDGRLSFGSYRGLTIFHPDSVKIKNSSKGVFITSIRLFNEPIQASDSPESVLKQNILLTNELEFSYKQNFLTIEYTSIDYQSAQKCRFRYMLEGFHNEWIYANNDRRAVFTNLPPGEYNFRVQASSVANTRNEERNLKILITPPFWETSYFRISLIFILGMTTYSLFRLRINAMRKRQEKLENIVTSRTKDLKNANQELVHKNEQIKGMANKLHEADEMKLRFFTNIHHEFRTSLQLILGPLESVNEDTLNQPFAEKSLLTIKKNAKRLLNLINQILVYRSVDAGNGMINIEENNIEQYLKNITDQFNFFAQKLSINYNFQSNIKNTLLYFDPEKVEKIMFNLLSNAFKHTPAGGTINVFLNPVKLRSAINISITIDKNFIFPVYEHPLINYIEIKVEDTGCGFKNPEQLENAFKRFYNFNSGTGKGKLGTGIGLSIVKELIYQHHGFIVADGNRDRGATFCFYLPADDNWYSNFDNVSIIKNEATSKSYSFDKTDVDDHEFFPEKDTIIDDKYPTILIIEDNIKIQGFLKQNLNNYNLLFSADGLTGMKKARGFFPDIILCDVMLPDIEGFEIVKTLKNETITSHIPIVMLTALFGEDNMINGLNHGADDYITKPFSISHLDARIRNLLNLREKLREIYHLKGDLNLDKLTNNPFEKEQMKKIKLIIQKNLYKEDFSVDMLAGEMCMSRMSLYRKIQNYTNQGPGELIRKTRLNYGMKLIKENKYSINEIAVMVGFGDASSFTRSFSNEFGAPPTKFLKDS